MPAQRVRYGELVEHAVRRRLRAVDPDELVLAWEDLRDGAELVAHLLARDGKPRVVHLRPDDWPPQAQVVGETMCH